MSRSIVGGGHVFDEHTVDMLQKLKRRFEPEWSTDSVSVCASFLRATM